jgi:hypothetical protein
MGWNNKCGKMFECIKKKGSSWKRVGKLMDLKRYNMALNKGERASKGARKSV